MLYLTYDNEGLGDGAGAQIQRILSIYLIAKHYKIGYIHQGLAKMSYQGARSLTEDFEDTDEIARYNQLISLPSTPFDQIHQSGKVFDISEQIIQQFADSPLNTLLFVKFAGTMIDARPELLLGAPEIFHWKSDSPTRQPIIVAIHVRRGELFAIPEDVWRMSTNAYYIECMNALHTLFTQANIPYEFHLHTEIVTKPVLMKGEHRAMHNRIKEPVLLRPEDNKLEEFLVIPNIHYHINEDPVDTLKALTTSDVLLASRSSFSYVSGFLKKGGVVLFPPSFWHGIPPGWIIVEGAQDIVNAGEAILSRLKV